VQDGRTYGVDYTHYASKPTAGVLDASVEVNKGLKLAAGCGLLAQALQAWSLLDFPALVAYRCPAGVDLQCAVLGVRLRS
jgi:hypothetical protein